MRNSIFISDYCHFRTMKQGTGNANRQLRIGYGSNGAPKGWCYNRKPKGRFLLIPSAAFKLLVGVFKQHIKSG